MLLLARMRHNRQKLLRACTLVRSSTDWTLMETSINCSFPVPVQCRRRGQLAAQRSVRAGPELRGFVQAGASVVRRAARRAKRSEPHGEE